MIRGLLIGVAVVVALPGAAAVVRTTVLTIASFLYREPRPGGDVAPVRFLVMIPARNEEKLIGTTLESLRAVMRPRDSVVVIADRCSDATAAVARSHGAEVLERGPGEEPGRGPARQAGLEYARRLPWDALVMIDADSVVEEGFFDACERMLATGAESLQARSEYLPRPGVVGRLALANFALEGVTLPRGRDALRSSVRLRGTGMVLSRRLVEGQAVFRSGASEDLRYGLDLCLAGIRSRHVESARLRSVSAGSWQDASTQKLRHEAGRINSAREYLLPLLRRGTWACLEAAWFLATPPLAASTVLLLAGTALAVAAGAWPVAVVTGGFVAVLGVDVLAAMAAARLPASAYLALLAAPWYLAWKVPVQLRAVASVRRRETDFPAMPRDEVPTP